MVEDGEIRSQIGSIRGLFVQLEEQKLAIKGLKEKMPAVTPKHPWSFVKAYKCNRLEAEIQDGKLSIRAIQHRIDYLAKALFEYVHIVADKATSTNSLELMLDLVEQTLDTDPEYRESVRSQHGVTDGTSYMCFVSKDNPKGMLPPTTWGREVAEEAYRRHQVQSLDPRLILLRTLATGSYAGQWNDYLDLMDFTVGEQVTMGPGLSTTATTPHWLGWNGILLVIEHAPQGVPMVGSRGDVPNESEVFIPDILHCTVLEKKTDSPYSGKHFELIYRLRVDSAESPIRDSETRK